MDPIHPARAWLTQHGDGKRDLSRFTHASGDRGLVDDGLQDLHHLRAGVEEALGLCGTRGDGVDGAAVLAGQLLGPAAREAVLHALVAGVEGLEGRRAARGDADDIDDARVVCNRDEQVGLAKT